MSNNQHFQALEAMMLRTPFVEKFDCAVCVDEGTAEFSIAITEDLFHGAGGLHGALYFFVMDNAAMLAANSYVIDVCVVTRNFTIQFLKPVSEGRVRATARIIDRRDGHFQVEAILYDSSDREIGRGQGDFVRSRYRLTNTAGYAVVQEINE
ncbi:MAG: PaaI family thioesterase [Fimbriimonadaceae bacterium]|nr:PaaI family thioesterase [Alphaproteobacteria bacterium]